ncbi:protein zer-1 homolog [Dreissena polymorpha]|uniref:Uncharacterized protein n=1 Tax=Dreissena polymorpha TaxID=45954 RepID=A0A9D4MDA7_DREPO|nr:protein zer-1 homolog [Dreissena polymorpha]XP_052267042.1 protein zer-1 homolog [Dreissena polymorpha]XP_052267043.1 protein zer-1 homolog [Dreissena polymorpha]XP_052267045.1 protein zer-1 homolog [Dreissena polymorpha]XP_052267046.1 protein zer-1 homolog [Dreissena polymorpha]KAH3873026.1 hypothetical protein DPMN_036251 [Dreissena polymorpha]
MASALETANSLDSLQQLCICYLVNHMDVLAASLRSASMEWSVVSQNGPSASLSIELSDRMLEYYSRISIHSLEKERSLNDILSTGLSFSRVSLVRRGVVSAENLDKLSDKNKFKSIELWLFEEDTYSGIRVEQNKLLESSEHSLCSLSLRVLCSPFRLSDIMHALRGKQMNEEFMMSLRGIIPEADQLVSNMKFKIPKSSNEVYNRDENQSPEKELICAGGDNRGFECHQDLQTDSLKSLTLICGSYLKDSRTFVVLEFLSSLIPHIANLRCLSVTMNLYRPISWLLSETWLADLQHLQSLTMSACYMPSEEDKLITTAMPYFFQNLSTLRHLRHLDISHGCKDSKNDALYTDKEQQQFFEAIKALPCLKSLDIAGTNLQNIIFQKDCMKECRRFDYLGLFASHERVCQHTFIPADKISGDANEEQLLVALWSYQHNLVLMYRVLGAVKELVRDGETFSTQNGLAFFEGLLTYLTKCSEWDSNMASDDHLEEKNIYSILYILYYLVYKSAVKTAISVQQRRRFLEQLLVVFKTLNYPGSWKPSLNAQRNKILRVGILHIMILDLEVVAVYSHQFEQYVHVLVSTYQGWCHQEQKELILRLLHCACRISQECKLVAGSNANLVQTMLDWISDMMQSGVVVDELLQKQWSILWTLTDEVPTNCALFVRHNGMNTCSLCIQKYSQDRDMLRKITGALSNVSENFHLHDHFMTDEMVKMCRSLLEYTEEGDYGVSSHAASILMMLTAPGPAHWTLAEQSREVILSEVDEIIKKWDIDQSKGIKYRSLMPMIRQLENYSTPTAQLWAAWIICNLLKISPNNYCTLLSQEGGLSVIQRVLEHGDLRPDVQDLLTQITHLHVTHRG